MFTMHTFSQSNRGSKLFNIRFFRMKCIALQLYMEGLLQKISALGGEQRLSWLAGSWPKAFVGSNIQNDAKDILISKIFHLMVFFSVTFPTIKENQYKQRKTLPWFEGMTYVYCLTKIRVQYQVYKSSRATPRFGIEWFPPLQDGLVFK